MQDIVGNTSGADPENTNQSKYLNTALMTLDSEHGINDSHVGGRRRRNERTNSGMCQCCIRRCRCNPSCARSRSTSRSRQEILRDLSPVEFPALEIEPKVCILESSRDSRHGHEHQDLRDSRVSAHFHEINSPIFANMEILSSDPFAVHIMQFFQFDQGKSPKMNANVFHCT